MIWKAAVHSAYCKIKCAVKISVVLVLVPQAVKQDDTEAIADPSGSQTGKRVLTEFEGTLL